MILKEIIASLKNAAHPVAKALHKGEHFKVLAIGFKKAMVLKEHQAYLPTKLFVLNGQVVYKENGVRTILSSLEEIEIPINILHSVEATKDSLCLLTQG
jgi:quercetin dioxygenase-like cupin family protein